MSGQLTQNGSRRASMDAVYSGIPSTERPMWAEVVLQALNDLIQPVNSHQIETDKHQARKFLINERGDWADARKRVCFAAGIDDTAVRAKALKLLAAHNAALDQRVIDAERKFGGEIRA